MSGVTDIDLGYGEIIEGLAKLDESAPSVLVGIRAEQGSDLVIYAGTNEFGSEDGHVPERSFLRSTVNENADRYSDLLQDALDELVKPGRVGILARLVSFNNKIERVGVRAVGDVQDKIRNLADPPNAASTIKTKKGVDNPLIETGRMRQSIDYAVVVE